MRFQGSDWTPVWHGAEPTATLAFDMLQGNGIEALKRAEAEVEILVHPQDADTAKELLQDWAI